MILFCDEVLEFFENQDFFENLNFLHVKLQKVKSPQKETKYTLAFPAEGNNNPFHESFYKIIFTFVEDTSKTSFAAAVRECNTSPLLVIQSVLKLIKACMLWCFIKGNVKEYIKLCHTN